MLRLRTVYLCEWLLFTGALEEMLHENFVAKWSDS
jgi:hypothetical protein